MRTFARTALRHAVRFVSHVLIVSGILMLADAAVTLAWQEPVSALQASREQHELEQSLERPPERVRERRPLPGDAIGRIVLPTLDRSYYVIEGTDAESLTKGPGHYPETSLPGERGTVAIAGHRTTYGAPFRTIDRLRHGDRIVVEMPYGTYDYAVQKLRIVDPSETSVVDPVGYQRLVLTACHPLYSAAQRIVVFARLVKRGPAQVAKG